MAEGDYHVAQKRGAWQVEQEGSAKSNRIPVEQLAGKDQAWRVALFYAQAERVDVFLHEDRRVTAEKHFREKKRRR